MDLQTKEVARLLNASEGTLLREIPSYNISGIPFFNSEEVEQWVMKNQRLTANQKQEVIKTCQMKGKECFCLYRAIHKGGVIHVDETERNAVIHRVMEYASKALSLDGNMLSELIIERENLMSTALYQGVAVPHIRNFCLESYSDIVIIAFLKQPVDWNSLNGQPVHTLFFLFACSNSSHLQLLAKIAHLSQTQASNALFSTQPKKEPFLIYVKEWESQLMNQTA